MRNKLYWWYYSNGGIADFIEALKYWWADRPVKRRCDVCLQPTWVPHSVDCPIACSDMCSQWLDQVMNNDSDEIPF